jgi:predicted nucleic acid-binding protein
VALAWKDAIAKLSALRILICELRDLHVSWDYFRRGDLHKLSAVDATSFAIMKRARLRLAYTFDHHFAVVGFRVAG